MNAEQVGYFIKRNMPTILSIGAAVGVVVSNILTNKASIKATLKVDEVEKKKKKCGRVSKNQQQELYQNRNQNS